MADPKDDVDSGMLIVELADFSEGHMGLNRKTGDSIFTMEPQDANSQESGALATDILRLAEANGAKVERKHGSREDHRRFYDLGRSWHEWVNLISTFATAGSGLVFLKLSHSLLLQWLKNKGSRTLTIKRGKTTVTLRGSMNPEEVKALFDQIQSAEAPAADAEKVEKDATTSTPPTKAAKKATGSAQAGSPRFARKKRLPPLD